VVKGWVLAEGENGVFKIQADNSGSLVGQLFSGGGGNYGGRQDKPLEGTEANAISKSH
jgi:hypothetical protein